MDYGNILIVIIIGVVVYLLMQIPDTVPTENIENTFPTSRKGTEADPRYLQRDANYERLLKESEVINTDGVIVGGGRTLVKPKQPLCKLKPLPNFNRGQFHNDYRDVISATNNVMPQRRQFFNLANQPIAYSEPCKEEVQEVVNGFIDLLNYHIYKFIPECRTKNSGWDEPIKDKVGQSGWEKHMTGLGLEPSLYAKPANKAPLQLVDIQHIQKYVTDAEVKYSMTIIAQKTNATDQIVMRVSLVQNTRESKSEDKFHMVTKNDDIFQVMVEELLIEGYLTNKGAVNTVEANDMCDTHYNFDNMEKNNMSDPKLIQKLLMDKYKERKVYTQLRNETLDEEGREFHKTLPTAFDYVENIRATQTIFDDMNGGRVFV